MHSNRKRAKQARGAFMSMELVMTLPILLILLLAMLEFSMLFFARGSVVEASRLGARKAALPGATPELVEEEVLKVLSMRLVPGAVVHTEIGPRSGDIVSVVVQVPMGLAAPDLLWPIGYSLDQQFLIAETRMVRE